MKKDLIIGCSTNYTWDTLKYWINSAKMTGFAGDIVLVLMNCDKETAYKVAQAGVKIVGFNQDNQGNLNYSSKIPVHVERFLHIYNYLDEHEYNYVVTTDVKDVIFQTNPFRFLDLQLGKQQQLMFASESMKYCDEPWGNQNLLETYGPYIHEKFKNNVIYNVGVLAGRHEAMKALMINIFTAAINRPIPICDQSTFNFMISQLPYTATSRYMESETGWACQLGTTADPSKREEFKPFLLEESPEFVDGVVTTSMGNKFCIVHQYDRVPEWRKEIEVKYG